MMLSLQALYLTIAFLFPLLVTSQQYVGAAVANSLPTVPGSNLTFFAVKDAKNNKATFTNYLSLNSSGAYMPPSAMKRLLVIIHGLERDPYTYMSNGLVALSQVSSGPTIDNTQIVCPYFPNVSVSIKL